ncbi:MAG: serine/threonine protein kinase [Myxococcota bacterium]|nr:serine/threonine protein kinase [Myxococcota bacterium]
MFEQSDCRIRKQGTTRSQRRALVGVERGAVTRRDGLRVSCKRPMRTARDYLGTLATLHRMTDFEQRRGAWRQSMATLGGMVDAQTPVPLEGLHPDRLLDGVRAALESGLVDDLSFLSAPTAAAALYELAAALPAGTEKRELGRRVLRWLHEADAATFVALATRLALGARRVLSGPRIRARVALCLDLPFGAGAHADALALALISRRDVEREWLSAPATGSLPSRRLAARLLERAAREAARRAAQGDDSGLRVFALDTVRAAWRQLLADREPLVWRHVAAARGLLAEAWPAFAEEVQRDLDPTLSPTEWRRAAASVAASIAVRPTVATRTVRALLDGELPQRDPGIVAAMVLGLPRAAEAEPEAVDEVLPLLVRRGGLEAIEALVELRRERIDTDVGAWSTELGRAELRRMLEEGGARDDGKVALVEALIAELAPEDERDPTTLPERLGAALLTYATRGARAAYEQAGVVLELAEGTVNTLCLGRDTDTVGRRHALRALREIDHALLEKGTLGDLLLLGGDSEERTSRTLDALFERLTEWLCAREREPIAGRTVHHLTYRMRRMRTLLHLVDADGSWGEERGGALRARRQRTARLLLRRVAEDSPSPLRRVVCAAAARACDALVREEVWELSDALFAAATHCRTASDIATFGEASMVPDVSAAVRAYGALHGVLTGAAPRSGQGARAALDGLVALAQQLPPGSPARVEALRSHLLQLVRSLENIAAAGSLREVAEGAQGAGTLLGPLEVAAQGLAELGFGTRRRCGEDVAREAPATGSAIRLLDYCIERALRSEDQETRASFAAVRGSGTTDIADALEAVAETMRAELPPFVADVALCTLERLRELPVDAPRRPRTSFLPAAPREPPLPAWLPPSRTLGGFYVVRTLGSGAVGSVFVARRVEERHAPDAEQFALKVPQFDGAAARSLSEAEFLRLFREEASALLTVPAHPNLARFVTFDAGARPKPILVMELVEGPSLERVIEMGDLDVARAFEILDAIASGLEAMHAVGVGHLDVKPSNVILRDPDGLAGPQPARVPVLVDFGLAGRRVRPGCATAEYGAPEIWTGRSGNPLPMAPPADVYAFGCLIFEVLTGRTLFDAPSEMGLLTAHLTHDGGPPVVDRLAANPATRRLAELLRRALRRNPEHRASISELRERLAACASALKDLPWPLPLEWNVAAAG